MKSSIKLVLATIPLMGLVLPIVGCEVGVDAPPPRRVVVREYSYDPGYYYDDEYYDSTGYYHPRVYFYYDGHGRWEHRDYVPRGYQVRVREHRDEHRDDHRDRR